MANVTAVRDAMSGTAFPIFAPAGAVAITIAATTANIALPASSEVVRVSASGNCWIQFGTSGVTAVAGNVQVPAGVVDYLEVPAGATHVACIADGAASGSLGLSKVN